jgi:RND family efflux transporter MFP subunit
MRDHTNSLKLQLPLLIASVAQSAAAGCNSAADFKAAPPPPAKVATIAQEEQLNTIKLTPEAEARLGIATATVELRPISRVRSYSGEIALPPGASLVISAPVGGTLQPPTPANIPAPGNLVTAKQPIFLLMPLLSPERDVLSSAERIRLAEARNALATSRIDAEGQVQQAQVQLEAAKIAFERAQRLFRESAGTARAVDDAKAQLNLAEKSLEAAESRKKLLESVNLEGEAGQPMPLVIESPQSGMLRSVNATAGKVVTAGEPLFEVMRFDPIWVRVPVYAGETSELATDQSAQVAPLNAASPADELTAKPVPAPPTATLSAATIDLYFELGNPQGGLRPGQRMTVRVKLKGASNERIVPWSAVMHDIHGGNWVYENTSAHTYVRRRVQVRYVVDALAVLESGPPVGSKIVTAGAMELFGTEFGFAK